MRAKLKWAVPVGLACAAAAVLLLRTPNDGAQYGGKDLTYWLWEAVDSGRPDAQEAILNILTNHCEALLRRMAYKSSNFEKKRFQTYIALPTRIQQSRPVGWLFGMSPREQRQYAANMAFNFSGAAADIVTAQLEPFISPTNPLSRQAVLALAFVGPETEALLENVATNRSHPWRLDGIRGLSRPTKNPAQVQRTLTSLLTDPDPNVRREADIALSLVKAQTDK